MFNGDTSVTVTAKPVDDAIIEPAETVVADAGCRDGLLGRRARHRERDDRRQRHRHRLSRRHRRDRRRAGPGPDRLHDHADRQHVHRDHGQARLERHGDDTRRLHADRGRRDARRRRLDPDASPPASRPSTITAKPVDDTLDRARRDGHRDAERRHRATRSAHPRAPPARSPTTTPRSWSSRRPIRTAPSSSRIRSSSR